MMMTTSTSRRARLLVRVVVLPTADGVCSYGRGTFVRSFAAAAAARGSITSPLAGCAPVKTNLDETLTMMDHEIGVWLLGPDS